MIPITLAALASMFSICLCQLPVLLNVSPRCLWLFTNCIKVLLNIRFGNCTNCFRVKSIASVLSGLKLTSHCFAQLVSTRRSQLIIPAISNILVAE